jgi:serine/threonine protein kinase
MNDFAIKVFDNRAIVNSATGYLREREVHMGIAGLDHKHLVKMLTSFTYEGNYYMIFPFASCDLWDYMKKNPKFPYNDPKKIFWLITQVVGLAEALEKIHRPGNASRFGQHLDTNPAAVDADSTAYHHDIKHDNILLFIEGDHPEGILRLSDFGCGKVATLLLNAAGKKESHRTPTKGNPTFEAPEGFSGSTSRPYDIWSIACVFLELLVWAIQGFPKINQFEQNRSSPVSQERPTEDDRFYYLEKGGKIYLKQAVQDKISELKGLTKHNEALHQLLEVLVKLFVIEPEKRPKAPELVKMLRPLKSLAGKKLRSSDRPVSGSKVTAVSSSVQRSHDNIPEVKITEAKL